MIASRAVRRLLAVAGLLAASAATAGTPALVVDVDTGRVIYADRATDPWYPASITKLMTTYVALEMVRDGRARMDQLLTLSPEAAAQPPSKMGLQPGTQIRLDNALKIIMVKSANDIAAMIGENLGGSVDGFAALMNNTARRLGMRESRWFNQNGLPDERQQTSARDMAILGRALLRDFPDQAGLFHIPGVKLGRIVMRNHNGLLGRYEGADGMKTGFICAGGFNIVASATRGGRRLIAVVLGSRKAAERDLIAAELFDRGFESSGWGLQTLDGLASSASASPPNMRPFVCGGGKMPSEDDLPATTTAQTGGNNENAAAATLFAPSAFAFASTAAPLIPRRTSLGPRVAFAPVPVWLGANPGTALAETEPAPVRPARIAAKPVRTKMMTKAAGSIPASARAFTQTEVKPLIEVPKPTAKVETVKAKPSVARQAALKTGLDPKPATEQKVKAAARPARAAKPQPAAATAAGSAPKAQAAALARPAAAKPKVVAQKPAAPARSAAAQPGEKPKAAAKPALKPAAAPVRAKADDKPAG
jgi:D-alanyl-D-alanine carboxypeptidase